jgi:hypothetical protein
MDTEERNELNRLDDRFHESNHIRCRHKFLVSPCGAATSS